MRKFTYWYLPIVIALCGVSAFGTGFYWFLSGNTGQSVDAVDPRTARGQAPRGIISAIVLGDSLARGTGDDTGLGISGRLGDHLAKRKIPAKPVVNLAVNGARTTDVLRQLDSRSVRTLIAEANVVVISIGGNDLWGSTDWRQVNVQDPEAKMNPVLDRIGQVVKEVRQANPQARIFFIGLYNPFGNAPFGPQLSTLVKRWNAKLSERFAADANFIVVPTADIFSHNDRLSFDRFHPGAEGYEMIARRIADAI